MRSINKKDVLYDDVRVNGQPSRALIDMGATHNFMSSEEAKRFDLKVKQDMGWSKGSELSDQSNPRSSPKC